MKTNEEKPRTRKLVDAIIISSLSSVIATVIGGVAFMVYTQARDATNDIRDIKIQLQKTQAELKQANDTIISELAPLRAEHEIANKRFDEISRFLQTQSDGFSLPESPTYGDIKKEEDDLKDQFNPTQQQAPPNINQ